MKSTEPVISKHQKQNFIYKLYVMKISIKLKYKLRCSAYEIKCYDKSINNINLKKHQRIMLIFKQYLNVRSNKKIA